MKEYNMIKLNNQTKNKRTINLFNRPVVPVFFASDKNYIPYLDVAIQSLIDHSSTRNEYRIYVLTTDISKEDFAHIKSYERENIKIEAVDVKDKIAVVRDKLALRDYFTEAIYFRLFIPTLFPNYKKAVYLDADITLNDDIAKLYKQNLKNNNVAAILDPTVYNNSDLVYYVREALDVTEEEYFNSGVLVMNLERFRKMDIENKFYDWVNDHSFGAVAPDQDFLNITCLHKVLYIDKGWNAMPAGEELADKDLHLIHYNMFLKPWKHDNVMYEDYFWKYAKKSIYLDRILADKAKRTEQDKINDIKGCENLCKTAIEIVTSGQNYKSVVLKKKNELRVETKPVKKTDFDLLSILKKEESAT